MPPGSQKSRGVELAARIIERDSGFVSKAKMESLYFDYDAVLKL